MAPGLPCPALALGLLALLLPGTRSDCGPLPTLTRAIPTIGQMESFPVGTPVTYRCRKDFVKIPGMSDTAQCLQSSEWSPLQEFCGRSCGVPTRLKFAALSREDETKSYYPIGINVTYTCRPAYQNITALQLVSTCFENLTWSEVPELCKRKSCGPPGELLNGRAVQETEFLFGDKIQFVCEEGYKLIGRTFIQCIVSGDKVEWSKLPACRVMTCSTPPDIANGTHDGKDVENPVINTTVTYRCDPGFQLVGASSIHCKTEDKKSGNWSGPAPECNGKSCGLPGELLNGRAVQGTKYLFGDKIQFVCEEGYKLIGQSFIQCILKGDEVEWSELPTCQEVAKLPTQPKPQPKTHSHSTFQKTPVTITSFRSFSFLRGDGSVVEVAKLPTQPKPQPKTHSHSTFQKTPVTITSSRSSSFLRGDRRVVGRWAPLPRFRFVMPLYKDQNYCFEDNKGSSICRQSYMGISGVLPSATCFNNFKWSEVPSLCGKRSWLSRRTNAWQSCCYSRFPIRCKSVFHP